MQPAVSNFDCAGFVGVTEDREPLPDGGPVQFVEGGFPALSLEPAGEERHRLAVQPQSVRRAPFGAEMT